MEYDIFLSHLGRTDVVRKFENLKKLLKKDDPIIIEVGSHYGEDTLRFLESFRGVNLFCFEPDPRNIEIFKKYVNDSRVKLFEVALSDKKGKASFYQSYQEYNQSHIPDKYEWIDKEDYIQNRLNNSGSSSLKKGYPHILQNKIEVETDRFDNFYNINNISEIDLAWIDVQGAEREVIEGMGSQIKKIKYIFMEYGETLYEGGMSRKESLALMNKKGFEEIVEFSSKNPQGDILCKNSELKKIC